MIQLPKEPFVVELIIDGEHIPKNFHISQDADTFRNAIRLRFKTFFATRKLYRTLKETIYISVPINYYLVPSTNFQAFKKLFFPKRLLNRFPVKYEKQYTEEIKKIDLKVPLDIKAIYPDIEIDRHPVCAEIKILNYKTYMDGQEV